MVRFEKQEVRSWQKLDADIRFVKGIGRGRAINGEAGKLCFVDLIFTFPRAYEDRTQFRAVSMLRPGETACVRAMVAAQPRSAASGADLIIVKLRIADESGTLNVTFFNQSYVRDSLKIGGVLCFLRQGTGTVLKPELINPIFEREEASGNITGRIMPIYRLSAGCFPELMAKAVRQGLDARRCPADPLPATVRETQQLAQARFAYENIHFPKDYESLESRKDSSLRSYFVLSAGASYAEGPARKKSRTEHNPADLNVFYDALPFVPDGRPAARNPGGCRGPFGGIPHEPSCPG
jgi:ATP-dependent DNA helicase RecG